MRIRRTNDITNNIFHHFKTLDIATYFYFHNTNPFKLTFVYHVYALFHSNYLKIVPQTHLFQSKGTEKSNHLIYEIPCVRTYTLLRGSLSQQARTQVIE